MEPKKINLLIKRILSISLSVLPCTVVLFKDPLNLSLLIILVLYFSWTLVELSLQSWEANAAASQKPYDKKSRSYIVVCRHASLWLSCLNIILLNGENHNFNIVVGGIIMVLSGSFLRFLAITKLKEHFTMEIDANEKQEIISNGIYRYIRHPSYLGILLIFSGFPLISCSIYFALIALIMTTVSIVYRINIEEKLLLKKTKNRYSEYMERTSRLFPFIY